MGKWGELIAGSVGAILFSAFIIFDTFKLIKRYNYDDYIEAASAFIWISSTSLSMVEVMDGASS